MLKRLKKNGGLVAWLCCCGFMVRPCIADAGAGITFENQFLIYEIGADGGNLRFIDKTNGRNHCVESPIHPCARLKKDGKDFAASSVLREGNHLKIGFGDSGVTAVVRVTAGEHYLMAEVVSVSDDKIDELVFTEIMLDPKIRSEKPFSGCVLALNLKTNVPELPGPNSRLRAFCYPRFGLVGARAGIIGCPHDRLRTVMQEVVSATDELPHSPLGGPWAMDAPINQGSYLFNFGDMSEQTVDEWIDVARRTGMNQIDFHGGQSFRFGDCRPNEKTYPNGRASFKAVIDRLHAAGLVAGLHTYAFFIDKHSEWVSPVPDPRLAKDATFTLAEDLKEDARIVPVVETTEKMSTLTAFFVWNSITLQIDNELIVYQNISKQPPYAFTDCQRGAWGTKVSPHAKGAKVHHLKECFGLFLPDGDSTLLTEVAARTADFFNECGFDMIYLDALDGEGILGGPEAGWYYGSRFVFEIVKRLKKPALMEMSTFHHHLWYVRSRYVAWDHPTKAYKKFVDLHCAANEQSRQMFLAGHLGWWAVKMWSGHQIETTFADDIEYLCCKCLATDTGFSLQGIDPTTIKQVPAFERLAGIMRRYEELRHKNCFSEEIKSRLRVPGDEYTLVPRADGEWTFRPMRYDRHKVEGLDEWSAVWRTKNPFGPQPIGLRIEALHSVGPYDAPANPVIIDFDKPGTVGEAMAADGMTGSLAASMERVQAGKGSGRFEASSRQTADGLPSYVKVGKKFSPPVNLDKYPAMGVWVWGDGQGAVLNFQRQSPSHVTTGINDHYVKLDFNGWRYFELVEPESVRVDQYSWPYGGAIYGLYRELVNMAQVESLNIWINHVPKGKAVLSYISPIRGLPLIESKITNPAIIHKDKTIVFPVTIETGCYLEFNPPTDCRLYGRKGELLAEVKPQGNVPVLEAGDNEIRFVSEKSAAGNPRAYVTVISGGEPLK